MKFNTHFSRDISSEPFSPSGDKIEEDYMLESTPFGDKLVSSGKNSPTLRYKLLAMLLLFLLLLKDAKLVTLVISLILNLLNF